MPNDNKTTFQKKKVLLYNKFWNFEFPDFSKLNIPDFEILTEKDYKYRALIGEGDVDVVVFHIPSLELETSQLLKLKKNGQIWVYWSMECPLHFPRFDTPELSNMFDIRFTYERDADISTPYINSEPDTWRADPKPKTGFVNAFFTSDWDKSGRYDYLEKLMSYLPIDSFGKIFNNKKLEDDPYLRVGGVNVETLNFKQQTIARYKFTLAFENAIAKDYVTEKFFHPLQMGSVPVYLGAPNVQDFAPGDKCYIDIRSFPSPKDLADYLLLLNNRDDLYNEYLNWKKQPLRVSFQSLISSKIHDPLGKLLSVAREKFAKSASPAVF